MKTLKLSRVLPLGAFRRVITGFDRVGIAVLGDVILDNFVWGEVRRICPEAPVPVVEVMREDFVLGGAGNVALNLQSLGGRPFLFGSIGRDENGRIVTELLRARGIENFLSIRDNVPTITKTRIIARTQQVVRIDREDRRLLPHAHAAQVGDLVKSRLPDLQGMIVSDYGKGFVTPALIRTVRGLAAGRRKVLTVDPKIEHFSYYRKVTCLTPNRQEASAGVHWPEPADTAELIVLGDRIMKLLQSEHLLITLGREGMVLFDRAGRVFLIPTVAREVFDVTGAGDTVISALTLSVASGVNMLQASIIANFAAGVVVGKLGTASLDCQELAVAYERGFRQTTIQQLR